MTAVKTFTYHQAYALNVVDGDTLDAVVSLTPDLQTQRRIRIRGIDAPEIRTADPQRKQAGLYAKALLEQLLKHTDIQLVLHGHDHYGRWVCDVSNADYTDIAGAMVAMGGARVRRTDHKRLPDSVWLYDSEWIETRRNLEQYEDNQYQITDLQ